MPSAAIQYFNRYTQRVETEEVYGEGFLAWTYGNPLGRASLHALVKRSGFSRWYGRRMNSAASKKKIRPFIQKYGSNPAEFARSPETFKTFNEFFFRKLRSEARPINPNPDAAVFPADGRHLGFKNIAKMEGIFVKGQVFDLEKLFQNKKIADDYAEG